MEWDDLRYVLATARSGSFLGASQRLKVTHTTVGRRVKALERDLGQALFRRTRKGMVPTEFCQKVIPTAEAIEREVRNMSLSTAEVEREPEGTVRIHTAHWLHEHVLAPQLPKLHSVFPKVRPYFVGDVRDSISDLDIPSLSIRAEGMAKSSEIEVHLVKASYSVYHLRNHDPEQMQWVSFLAEKMGTGQVGWLKGQGYDEDDISALANDAALVKSLVATGHYKGLLPHLLADNSADLERVNTNAADLQRSFCMITARRSVNRTEVKVIMDWVKKSFADAEFDAA